MSGRMISPFALLGVVVAVAVMLVAAVCVAQTPESVLTSGAPPTSPGGDREQVGFTLPAGSSAQDIGEQLENLGVIRSGQQFEFLVGLMGVEKQLSSGDYLLRKNTSALVVVRELSVQEAVPVLKVTFPEGIRFEEMAEIAEEAGFGTRAEFLEAVATAELPPGFAPSLPEGASLQGYLFPDTYIMPVGSTAADLVAYMLRTLALRFTPELRAAAQTRGLNPHQALTLASIVEREAVLDEERPLIAGVFYNRLAASDLLGADPTTQFSASLKPGSIEEFGYWKKELTQEDLDDPSPYNTRAVPGLPPGPITNPGLAAIEAVANPVETLMYYFVADAKADDGSHRFAETEEGHFQNIALYGSP